MPTLLVRTVSYYIIFIEYGVRVRVFEYITFSTYVVSAKSI